MGQSEVLNYRQRAANLVADGVQPPGVHPAQHLALMLMFSLLRLALFIYNRELIGATPASTFVEAFVTGLRFDIRAVVYAIAPMVFALLSAPLMRWRLFWRIWLSAFASVTMFLGLIELDFYREFHQRLNGLVFQYMKEDPKTVMSMLWYGFPVVRYLLAWAFGTWLLSLLFKGIDRATRPSAIGAASPPWYKRLPVMWWSCCSAWSPPVAPCARARRCAGVTPSPPTRTSSTSWA
jgi:phosphoglycerol transferase MdoB-like AlkP superfamily enzyme